MKITIIILSLIIGILIAIILIISNELRIEIDKRQFYESSLRTKLKEIELKNKIIYSQRVNIKHLNKIIKNKKD